MGDGLGGAIDAPHRRHFRAALIRPLQVTDRVRKNQPVCTGIAMHLQRGCRGGAKHHPAAGGAEHRKQGAFPHLLQLGDVTEFISEDEVGSLPTQSIGVVGTRQDQLRTIPEVQRQLGLVSAIEPGVGHHRLQVRPGDVLCLFAAWRQIEDLRPWLLKALFDPRGEHQPRFTETAPAEHHLHLRITAKNFCSSRFELE